MKKLNLLVIILMIVTDVTAQQKHQTENIFIITLDGLRWQEVFGGADSLLILNKDFVRDPLGLKSEFWAEKATERRKILMPFFWNVISSQGQLYGNRHYKNNVNCTNGMWFSYPGYNEILCGYADDARIKSNNKIDNPNVTILEHLNRLPSFKNKVAAFGSWDVFPFIINENRSGIPVNAGFDTASEKSLSERERFLNQLQSEIPSPWSGVRLDGFTQHFALEYIKKHSPRVVFISYGETDDFAHEGRYDEYLHSAKRTDQFIGDLWNFVQKHKTYRNKTTFIITTDHGRGTQPIESWKSHGSEVSGAGEIWIAVIGPDTEPIGEVKTEGQNYQSQVAKTAARFLDVPYNPEIEAGEVIQLMMRKTE